MLKGFCEKANAIDSYTNYLQMNNMEWQSPKYKKIQKIPFIPTEIEIDQLIAGCGKKTATLLQLLKETGMRIGEAWQLNWKEIDYISKGIRVTPEKGSNPRVLKISDKLILMLKVFQGKSDIKRIFSKSL
jgi:integrase